ncbi:MAG: hypothetical protein FWD65_04850 [Coriobacteriia bacterium]|nr:hypothetical protein [Coriobacteriia bacterium]
MLNEEKKKALNEILKDKPETWLRQEIVRLCAAFPDGLELIILVFQSRL